MIAGTVQNLEPTVPIRVRGDSMSIDVNAVVDTGFTGELTLPLELVEDLDLEFDAEMTAMLADGTLVQTVSYFGIVEWNGVDRSITVMAGEGDILLGMMLMRGHNLFIEVAEGGAVRIELRQ